ncbi:hypothetical protein NDU88_002474 [Pleurodeles waltl]|uniref:Uncharacterized protein n=1 Tax=Pleurodeles waltl TaxID=8319 RepID=A0AAV7UBC3_PLEWA|nr:hypothetical protein NDU88_002474 [Pleurodeles waltl]
MLHCPLGDPLHLTAPAFTTGQATVLLGGKHALRQHQASARPTSPSGSPLKLPADFSWARCQGLAPQLPPVSFSLLASPLRLLPDLLPPSLTSQGDLLRVSGVPSIRVLLKDLLRSSALCTAGLPRRSIMRFTGYLGGRQPPDHPPRSLGLRGSEASYAAHRGCCKPSVVNLSSSQVVSAATGFPDAYASHALNRMCWEVGYCRI